MNGLFLLVGLSLFLTGFSIYFRHALRHDRGVGLAALILPPVTWAYYGRRRSAFRLAAYLQIGGIASLLAGGLLWWSEDSAFRAAPKLLLHSQHNEFDGMAGGLNDTYMTRVESARHKISDPLAGKLNGHPFSIQSAEYIDGVLKLSQTGGYYSASEVSVFLGNRTLSGWSELLVSPGDQNVPEIHISWFEPGESIAETKIYKQGYSLDLQVEAAEENRLHAQMELILPDAVASFFVGVFDAYLNHLRYVDGRVDIRWDSQQTLQYVVAKYLKNHYEFNGLNVVRYDDMDTIDQFDAQSTTQLGVVISDQNGVQVETLFYLEKASEGWQVNARRSDFSGLNSFNQTASNKHQGRQNSRAHSDDIRRQGFGSTPNLATVRRAIVRPLNEVDQSRVTSSSTPTSASVASTPTDITPKTSPLKKESKTTVSLEQMQGNANAGSVASSSIIQPASGAATVSSAVSSAASSTVVKPSTADLSLVATIPTSSGKTSTFAAERERKPEDVPANTKATFLINSATRTDTSSELSSAAGSTSISSSALASARRDAATERANLIQPGVVTDQVQLAPATAASPATAPMVTEATIPTVTTSTTSTTSTTEATTTAATSSTSTTAEVAESPVEKVPTAEEIALMEQKQRLEPYLRKLVSVMSKDGRAVKGLFIEIRNRKLVIETRFGGGKVEYFVKLDELESIELVRSEASGGGG